MLASTRTDQVAAHAAPCAGRAGGLFDRTWSRAISASRAPPSAISARTARTAHVRLVGRLRRRGFELGRPGDGSDAREDPCPRGACWAVPEAKGRASQTGLTQSHRPGPPGSAERSAPLWNAAANCAGAGGSGRPARAPRRGRVGTPHPLSCLPADPRSRPAAWGGGRATGLAPATPGDPALVSGKANHDLPLFCRIWRCDRARLEWGYLATSQSFHSQTNSIVTRLGA